ncbi:hypothetical protein E4K67_22380 [Desulfosporosinus fructosivorans]|uniref:Baseplate protein J-like barrel domain-containing protein n=1 Tax=Desulfosporosinus fructosivorans TaxID=2018669 RepID=A0A4Z0QZC1_9FIRM|nr:baseplate J/gp47 family protein [Desulfosporosinus fructosivorans]TGE35868.1 hypothetical protein E4K67_22380 [Desulfosporosinus fructosivorans]
MAYFAPYIDATGLHCPTYQDIMEEQIQQARAIYGQDIYLGTDSQDYQYISTFALKMSDTLQAIKLVYDSRGPGTAIGSGLDILVKLNGIKRNGSGYSVATETLSGTPGTVINNGVVQDKQNYYWNLPPSVVIGTAGTVDAQVTCQTAGPIAANAGDIDAIATPTYGWSLATNALAAVQGVNAETDSQLKGRQSISTSQPSRTVLEGTKGAIAAVSGVTRFIVYENPTNDVDTDGLPPHSITAVVEGGSDADIAQAIFLKKGPGCLANGTTVVNITDQFGQIVPIGFYRPSYVDIDVVVNVKQLTGYTSATTSLIKTALVNYLDSLSIGDDLPASSLWGSSLSAMQSLSKPTFSITSLTLAKHGLTQGTADITIGFDEVVRGNSSYLTINVT